MTLLLQDAADRIGRLRRATAGLRARLFLLTVGVIMLVEVLIFIPSAATFRTSWLMERVERAQTASLALGAAPDSRVSDELARELFENSDAHTVAVKRDGMRELIWSGPPMGGAAPILVDLRHGTMLRRLIDTCMTFAAPRGRYLRVVDHAQVPGGEFIEVIVREDPLKSALWAFSGRTFFLSVLISAVTGMLVYIALAELFVRPMRHLARAMVFFREAPDDAARVIAPTGRRDEIGVAEAELASLQEQVRAALKQREHLAALGEAVAKINHDLRNILTSAQLVSDRLAANPDPQVRKQAERLVRATDRGVRLAEEVLAYGRADERPPDVRRVPLRAALQDAYDDAVAVTEDPAALDLRVGEDVVVAADPEHVHRIFLNLIRNAVQALARLEGADGPGVVTLTAAPNGAWVATEVSDDGPGIPETAREELFRPFAGSTRRGGSGLGLPIARELARANGGEVVLARSGPKGASFEVRLPAG
ncbi:MAG: HAMP domain-containing histidine kinase [Caulobacterales bacterium]|nr:HAMP domain-containing histidine kinase [Caulobacterales bacterium]